MLFVNGDHSIADAETKKRAIAFLVGRFPGKSWTTGEVAVPGEALAEFAAEGFHFTADGPVTYERLVPIARKYHSLICSLAPGW